MKVIRAHPHCLAPNPHFSASFVSPFEKSSLRMGNLSINEVPTEMVTLLHFPASLRVSACVTFCPRRVENVRISVLPVCKYKRCCIQYTNALRSGRKFGLEFFPLHSEHPSLSTQIPPNTSTRVKVTTQTTPIQTHKERAPTEAIEPTHGETTDTGRGMQKEPTTVLSGLPNSRNTIIIQRDQKFHSSVPGTYPRGSRKTPPPRDIRG